MISRATGDFFPDGCTRVQRVAGLVDVGQLHGVAVGDCSGVGFFLPGQHTEQGGFTRAVRADDADDSTGGEREAEILDQQLVAHGFFQAINLDHLASQPFAIGDNDLCAAEFFALGLVG